MIYYGLLLFLLFEYVRPGTFFPGLNVLHLNTIIPLSIVAGTIVRRRHAQKRACAGRLTMALFIFFLFLIGVSVFTADVTLYVYNVFSTVLGYVLVLWVIIREVTDLRRLKGVFTTLVFLHVLVAALTPEVFLDTEVRHYLAAGVFLGDGNDFALSVNIALPFCVFLFLETDKKRHKFGYGAAMLMLVTCVVLTQSRGGTIGLASFGLYYWLKSGDKFRTGVIAATAVTLILLYAPANYFSRMNTIGDTEEGSAKGRLMAWSAGVRMALDHPLLGVGPGHFPVKYGVEYRPPGYGRTDLAWQTAHSIYFLILGELGFTGLGVLVLFIVGNLAANWRLEADVRTREPSGHTTERRLLVCTGASLVAFATNGAFLSAIYYPHMYILAGLLVASRGVVLTRLDALQTPQESGSLGLTTAGRDERSVSLDVQAVFCSGSGGTGRQPLGRSA